MTGETCREDTVEHIDPPSDPFDEVFGCADTHEVVWFFDGEYR